MSRQEKRFYEFGPFHLDPCERVLLFEGKPVGLTPKVFDTLLVLIERSGHIVEKDELMRRIWPDSFVEEGNLAFNISVLRKALAEAHLSQATVKLFYNWDWAGFEIDLKRALELNPNYPDPHGLSGAYLCAMGKFNDSIRERKLAQELDPLSPFYTNSVGWSYFYARDFDKAIEWYKKALELDPTFAQSHNDLAVIYNQKGMYAEVVEHTLIARSMLGASPETLSALKQAYATSGIKGFWQKELELAIEQSKQAPADPHKMARIYCELGDKDHAFEWLEKALEERRSLMVFLKVNPMFDSLHADPRFMSLIQRIGLAQ